MEQHSHESQRINPKSASSGEQRNKKVSRPLRRQGSCEYEPQTLPGLLASSWMHAAHLPAQRTTSRSPAAQHRQPAGRCSDVRPRTPPRSLSTGGPTRTTSARPPRFGQRYQALCCRTVSARPQLAFKTIRRTWQACLCTPGDDKCQAPCRQSTEPCCLNRLFTRSSSEIRFHTAQYRTTQVNAKC